MNKIHTQPNISRRATASIIDYGIYMLMISLAIGLIGDPNNVGVITEVGWLVFVLALTWFVYFPIVESIKGQTLGHLIMKLRVVSLQGKPITFLQALKRRLLDIIEVIGSFGLIAYRKVMDTKHNQRIGDIWANTIVVGEESAKCNHCGISLTLSANDTISGSFNCPECGKKNEN